MRLLGVESTHMRMKSRRIIPVVSTHGDEFTAQMVKPLDLQYLSEMEDDNQVISYPIVFGNHQYHGVVTLTLMNVIGLILIVLVIIGNVEFIQFMKKKSREVKNSAGGLSAVPLFYQSLPNSQMPTPPNHEDILQVP